MNIVTKYGTVTEVLYTFSLGMFVLRFDSGHSDYYTPTHLRYLLNNDEAYNFLSQKAHQLTGHFHRVN